MHGLHLTTGTVACPKTHNARTSRLSDALYGDGFPSWEASPLADAVLGDALDKLWEQLKTRRRFAKEIEAAHADPDWPGGF